VKWRIWWRLHFNYNRESWDEISTLLGLILMLLISLALNWLLP